MTNIHNRLGQKKPGAELQVKSKSDLFGALTLLVGYQASIVVQKLRLVRR